MLTLPSTLNRHRLDMEQRRTTIDGDQLAPLTTGGIVEDDSSKKRRATGAPSSSSLIGGGRRSSSASAAAPPPCCQAERCCTDLTEAKRYHRRHKVCEFHAKAPVVLVAGLRQRFCQQCSRFHELSEFDEVKRSCRRRLAGHNERRRKSSSSSSSEVISAHHQQVRLSSSPPLTITKKASSSAPANNYHHHLQVKESSSSSHLCRPSSGLDNDRGRPVPTTSAPPGASVAPAVANYKHFQIR